MNAESGIRLFVIYNDIIKEDNKYYLKKVVTPIPVKFIVSKRYKEDLQKAFSYIRKLLVQSKQLFFLFNFNSITLRNFKK